VIADTTTRKGKRELRQHLFITSLRTAPEALLRVIRQRWSNENEWHWARDVQLGEDAHRYANRNGVPLCAFLRTAALNLLRLAGFQSIRTWMQTVMHDITALLAMVVRKPQPKPC
jgi:predicted transposase YbfD/YdcC